MWDDPRMVKASISRRLCVQTAEKIELKACGGRVNHSTFVLDPSRIPSGGVRRKKREIHPPRHRGFLKSKSKGEGRLNWTRRGFIEGLWKI